MEKRVKKERKKVHFENIMPKDEVLKKIGATLKAERKKNGYTSFEHYAYQMDIARSLFAKYEAGSDMKVSTLIRIVQGMGIKVSDFFKNFD